jgi:hypothetical protein
VDFFTVSAQKGLVCFSSANVAGTVEAPRALRPDALKRDTSF